MRLDARVLKLDARVLKLDARMQVAYVRLHARVLKFETPFEPGKFEAPCSSGTTAACQIVKFPLSTLLKAAYISSLRPYTFVAQDLIH